MIKVHKHPKLKSPYLIAAWPGMGSVALKAAIFLKDRLGAQEFAQIEPEGYFYPTDVLLEDSLIKMPKLPQGKFYFWENKSGKNDLVIFISDAQPPADKIHNYVSKLLDFAKVLKIKFIFTFAAMPLPIDHLKKPEVWATTTTRKYLAELKKYNVKQMQYGQISGLNGLFLGLAKEYKFPGICLLGEMPLYAIQIENPKSSLAVLEVLCAFINIKINLSELELAARTMEEEIEKLIEYLKRPIDEQHQPKAITEEEIEKIKKILEAQSKLPQSAKKKIDELFEMAKKDLSKANILKHELDSWNVYREYEDKFLDLFKKKGRKNN